MAEFEVKPFVILQTGDAPDVIRQQHGGFTDMFLQQGEINPASVVVVNLPAGEQLLSPEHYRGAIITGSAAMVTELLPWSEQAAVWLRDAVGMGLPILVLAMDINYSLTHWAAKWAIIHKEWRSVR